ncbi:MAG: hypothetical protein GC155_02225 [Alphaproteobacteria bacterium]|nr:hypothetical protein [Alphaproteobacteria bacterium]
MSVETWSEREPAGAAPARPRSAGRMRTRLGLADVVLQLWRSRWLMLLVFLPIALLGAAIALVFPTQYSASTRLFVALGQEGELRTEAELASSPVIADRVIKSVGLARLYPEIGEAEARAPDKARLLDGKARALFAKHFDASVSPGSSILRLGFSHPDPRVAAETLNTLVKVYLDYRGEVLDGRYTAGLVDQRAAIEGRLKAADESLRSFLAKNNISDFVAERNAVSRLLATLSDEISSTEASRSETEARIAGLRTQLAATPRQADLYVDTTSGKALSDLRLQREDLLTRYKPDSQTVQDIDRKIRRLETLVDASPQEGVKRVGANPTWQALATELASARATAQALQGRLVDLQRQRDEAEQRRAVLAAVAPDFQRLSRDRTALENSAQALAEREQAEQTRSELAARKSADISIFEPVAPPPQGASPRRLIALAGMAIGLALALVVGLVRAASLRTLPTARSVERTLRLSVLGAAGARSR